MPLLADPISNARRGSAAIGRYDLLLRDPGTAAALRPDVVCRIGELPTSKPLRAWLAGLEVPQIWFGADSAWSDPDSRLLQRTVAPLRELLDRIAGDEVVADTSDWLDRWRDADVRAENAIDATLPAERLTEPLIAATLGRVLPPHATLFVASSMPVRDLETYMPIRDQPPRVLSNRGANGIDGTVSAAFGVAAAGGGPVVLLIGDVALAHDLGGLLAGRRTALAITIVLVNNDGGGIFHFLPVAGQADAFEQHVATPHGLDFAAAAYAVWLRTFAHRHRGGAQRQPVGGDRLIDDHDPRGRDRPHREPGAAPARRAGGARRAQPVSVDSALLEPGVEQRVHFVLNPKRAERVVKNGIRSSLTFGQRSIRASCPGA